MESLLSQANFREDVTVSGDINSSDVIAVKLNSGNGVAAAPSNVKANRIRSANSLGDPKPEAVRSTNARFILSTTRIAFEKIAAETRDFPAAV